MDDWIKCNLIKFPHQAAGGNGSLSEGPIQRWVFMYLMKFNKIKCKVLPWSWGNPRHKYRLGNEWIESSSEDLGVLVAGNLTTNQ